MNNLTMSNKFKMMTMFTCVVGGAFWTKKYAQKGKNLLTFETSNTAMVEKTPLQMWSVTAILGAFYGYLALNVNARLLNLQLVDIDTLFFGYSAVIFGLTCDVAKEVYDYATCRA